MKTKMYFYDNILLNSRRMINVRTRVAEKIKTHILCPTILSPENPGVYEIMWKNTMHCCFSVATMVSQCYLVRTLPISCTFLSICAVPNVFFCRSLMSCFPWRLLEYFLSNFEIVPSAPIITGTTFVLKIQMHSISIVRS